MVVRSYCSRGDLGRTVVDHQLWFVGRPEGCLPCFSVAPWRSRVGRGSLRDGAEWSMGILRDHRGRHGRCRALPRSVPRHARPRGTAMNWDQVEGNWRHVKRKVKERWDRLTADDLMA